MTSQEYEDLEQITGNVAANLKYIEDHCPSTDELDELLEKTSAIAANLKYIEDHS